MKMALKYTLSKNIASAIPPGNSTLFLKALEFMNDFGSVTGEESIRLMEIAENVEPIFMHG